MAIALANIRVIEVVVHDLRRILEVLSHELSIERIAELINLIPIAALFSVKDGLEPLAKLHLLHKRAYSNSTMT